MYIFYILNVIIVKRKKSNTHTFEIKYLKFIKIAIIYFFFTIIGYQRDFCYISKIIFSLDDIESFSKVLYSEKYKWNLMFYYNKFNIF
jgi:hypothetical protein